MTYPENFTDTTPMATAHAAHHNNLSKFVNAAYQPFPRWVAGHGYSLPGVTSVVVSSTPSSPCLAWPFMIPNACKIGTVGIYVSTVAGAGYEWALYTDSADGPLTRLATGTWATSAVTWQHSSTLNLTFTGPTQCWLLGRGLTAASLEFRLVGSAFGRTETADPGLPSAASNAARNYYNLDMNSGVAFPADFTPHRTNWNAASNAMPFLGFRVVT